MDQPRRKLALAIGISNYENENVQMLKNPNNDAHDMSTVLNRIGFSVTTHLDPTYWEMAKACDDFRKQIRAGDIVVFYFAGHGTQWNDKNYLLPKDYEDTERNLNKNAIQAQTIVDDFTDRDPFVIIFLLDCCRNYHVRNWVPDGETRNISSFKLTSTGLQPMNANAGCLIAFACAPGAVSIDGHEERNGLFTKYLLRYIETPNEDIRMILADVTKDVIKESCGKQVPFLSAALSEKYITVYNDSKAEQQFTKPKKSSQYQNAVLEKKLTDCKDKTDVSLTSMQLNDNDLEIVIDYVTQHNKALTKLFLWNNRIGHVGAQYLATALPYLTTLTTLDLQYNQIGDTGLQHLSLALAKNKTLTTLNITGNQIEETGAQYLASGLQNNDTLTTLNISSNQLGDRGAQYLAIILLNKTAITTLTVVKNGIGFIGAQHLANALRQNETVTTLSIQYNKIEDTGAQYLSHALQSNKILTTLDLSNNTIGTAGTEHLAVTLQSNKTITTLLLSFNDIKDRGAQYLAEALQRNSTLKTLGLEENHINETGAQHLANLLLNNTTLTTLQLAQNNIGTSGAQYFVDALKKNKTLTTLTTWSNDISHRVADLLEEALQRNRRPKK